MPRNKSGSKRIVSHRFPTKTRNFRLKVTRKTKRSRKNNKTVKGGGWLFNNNTNINVEDLKYPNSRISCICEKLFGILTLNYDNTESEESRMRKKNNINEETAMIIKEIFFISDPINTTYILDTSVKLYYPMTDEFNQIVRNWETDKNKPEYKKIEKVMLTCKTMYIGDSTRFITYALNIGKTNVDNGTYIKKNTAYGVGIPPSTTIQVKNKDDSQIKSDQKTDVIDSVMERTGAEGE